MRVSSFPSSAAFPAQQAPPVSMLYPTDSPSSQHPAFLPFCAEAFSRARRQGVPVFLIIGETDIPAGDSSLSMQIAERTVPVRLLPGERPDAELLCRRASMLFSGEDALPLCALLTGDGLPFLAAPLPPAGFPLDPSRLYVWLNQADRRFMQNYAACSAQASEVVRSFSCPPLSKPYTPRDAAHDAVRSWLAAEDRQSGGFGRIKAPHPCALRLLQHAAAQGDKQAHAAVSRALDAMLSSALYDPVDGGFFASTLTENWRVFSCRKPLAVNTMLASILIASGRRTEGVRTLDFVLNRFSLEGGALSPSLSAPRESYAFTPEQVCAALGSEAGLRVSRLLGLLRGQTPDDPPIAPSRFSPVAQARSARFGEDASPRCPALPPSITPEDAAFLRRITPALLKARAAREPQRPAPYVTVEDCALSAALLAECGQRLGEPRYIQAAQRAVSRLSAYPPAASAGLPASVYPSSPLYAQATCGASAALSLALLTLGCGKDMEEYARSGLRLLSAALHAFVRPDGVVMHTPKDPAAFFPRVPALCDGTLPSPAALLAYALQLADRLCPQAHYTDAIETIWLSAAPSARSNPAALTSLIDAMTPA